MKVRDTTVWVIGASAGIGEHVAYECARRGAAKIILSARRVERLKDVKSKCEELGVTAEILELDVTDCDQISRTCDQINAQGGVDIVVNNAGVSQRSKAADTPIDIDRRIMEINYFGLIDISKRMIPSMIERGRGHFAVTSSVVGKFGFPLRTAYSSSKHALHGFFESLYLENKRNGIGITLVCPGRIKTEISMSAINADGSAHGEMDPGQAKGMPVELCAKKYVNGIEANRREVFIGKERILIYLRNFVPPLFYRIALKVNPK